MIPKSDHILPVLLLLSDAAHIIFIIFRVKSMLPAQSQHFFQAVSTGLPEGRLSLLGLRDAGESYKAHDICGHLFAVFVEPGADFVV